MLELIQKHIPAGPAVKLAAGIEELMRSGRIPPEALLPPVRQLARALRVSPGTAAAAYRALRRQGLVATDRRRGTRALPRPSLREYAETQVPRGVLDLRVASPDPELLPDLGKAFRAIDAGPGDYAGEHLEPALARWARKDFEADGIPARHLVVTSGALGAIYRALRACASPGEKVAVEDPGFNEHHACAAALSLVPVPVPVDDEGMDPGALRAALRGGASAVLVTARCQNPVGAAWSRVRAAALREVLAEFPGAAVVIDDYASQLTDAPYHGCLAADRERWLVVRSFNKVLAPELRVAVATGDAATIERIRGELWLSDGWVSAYLQRAAAAALHDRVARSLVSRARRTYSERRKALLQSLASRGIRGHGASGLNVWIPLPDEAAAVQGLLARGVSVRAGARYRLRSPPAIRITTARLPAGRAERLAGDLQQILLGDPANRGP